MSPQRLQLLAMVFSVFVEFVNMRIYRRGQEQPVDLHWRYSEKKGARKRSGP